MKDNFSNQSKDYAKFRPHYPPELFDFLISLTREQAIAWDCGTGNGQVAVELAKHFEHVFATDISENQINEAIKKPNITYEIATAEHTAFPDNYFDLITVAQAIHWFDFDRFYQEVTRLLKPDGIFAVMGYPLLQVTPEIDMVIHEFYEGTLNGYWDPERKYLDENYVTIPFPFKRLNTPAFKMEISWTLTDLTGFLNTWSGVQHYIKKNGINPVNDVLSKLNKVWPSEEGKKIIFPILLLVTRKEDALTH
jgi:SAM-dependent methyltransferase